VLTVDGIIDVNGGTLGCTGSPQVSAYGYEATNGQAAIACGTGPTTTQPALPDPLAPYLPGYPGTAYPTATFPAQPVNPPPRSSGACNPGEYTASLTCSTLEPGVYVLDAGLSINNITFSMAADAAGQGVLLYLPCNPPQAPTACNASIQKSNGGNGSINLAPLTAAQSAQYFGTSALTSVLIWQDKSNSAPDTFGGGDVGFATATLYMPSAAVTFSGNASETVGRIIAARVSLSGSAPLIVTGL
jgi:hypothetical protein